MRVRAEGFAIADLHCRFLRPDVFQLSVPLVYIWTDSWKLKHKFVKGVAGGENPTRIVGLPKVEFHSSNQRFELWNLAGEAGPPPFIVRTKGE